MSVVDTALSQIRQLQPYTPGKPVEELERELGISSAIKLASNENPLGCSSTIAAATQTALQAIQLYPDANAFYLKQKLCAKLGVKASQITIGNGSNDVLDLIARSFLDSGSEAIFSEFAFLVYPLVTQACGASARIAKANPADSEQPYGHDLDAMLALVNDKTRLVFIANPNNPTGTWLTRSQLAGFLDQLPGHIAVVIDEAYFEYVVEDDYPDSIEWLGRYENLIVTRTFSKIYGLAGLRMGYALSSEALCDLLNRVRQPFNGNVVAIAAACAALDDDEFVTRSRQTNATGLAAMMTWFDQREITYIPSVGNFLTVKIGANCAEIYNALLQQGIIVRPIGNYGLPEFLRISVGTDEQLQRLFAALDSLL